MSTRTRKHAVSVWLPLTAVVVLCSLWFAGCFSGRIARPRSPYTLMQMTVTGYCNCGICCSWEYPWYSVYGLFGSPYINAGNNKGKPKKVGFTANGMRAQHGTIAADPAIPFGTVIYVPGYGYGRVEDRGGAIQGNKLDLWFSTHEAAKEWGRKTLVVRVWRP